MVNLRQSFQDHLGFRGVHIYSEDNCTFLPWNEVIRFVNHKESGHPEEFTEKLLEALSNYNPDEQFLALNKEAGQISIEIYSQTH